MLKNFVFDFGGVICGFNTRDLVSHFYDEADREEAFKIIYREWVSLDAGASYWKYADDTVALMPDRLKEQTKLFFKDWVRFMPPIVGTWALMARLKAMGYGVYILSNASTYFKDCVHQLFPITHIVDDEIYSAFIRMIKPDRCIFDYACQKFGIKAEESLFVDDTKANIDAAKAAGWDGYHYDGDADKLFEYIKTKW
ncbi:MAG: HAD family phosphatase [Clostridia bacterium]|nr:HAD family phosphatase [Clostridia bacterium]